MQPTLDDWSDLLFSDGSASGTRITWGTVSYMNEDSSVQVKLNSSDTTTRCATWCKCSPGERVLVAHLSKGCRVVVANYSSGTIPDGSISPDKLDEETKEAIKAAEKAVVATYEEFTATAGRNVPPSDSAIWTEDVPDGVSLSRIWKRLVSVWGTGAKTYGDPEPMQRLVRIATEYYLSSSKDEPKEGSWSETPQGFVKGSYLFTRQRADYINPVSSEYGPAVLDEAWAAAQDAVAAAESAEQKANQAATDANAAKDAVEPFAKDIEDAKAAANEAKAAAASAVTEVASVKENYATKNDVTSITGSLSASIEANAAAISSKVSAEEYQRNTEEANKAIEDAKAAADEAKKAADDAVTDLTLAKTKLSELEQSQTATETELAAAKTAVESAQKAADAAQAAADDLSSSLEGIDQRVTAAETEITQASDSITSTVARVEQAEAEGDQLAQAIEALKSGELADMSGEITGIAAQMTQILQDYEKIQFDFSELSGSLAESGSTTEGQLSTINRFIRFVSGNIELGEDGSQYKVVIRKDRISFMNGDLEMAYMSGDKMFIKTVEVTEQLRIGEHLFESAKKGHMTLKYVGEEATIGYSV